MDELRRFGVGELAREWENKHVLDADLANEAELMGRRGEKMRGLPGSQNPRGMRIKCDRHRISATLPCLSQGAFDHRPMAKVHTVEDADRQKDRPRDAGQFADRREPAQPHLVRRSTGGDLTLPASVTRSAGP